MFSYINDCIFHYVLFLPFMLLFLLITFIISRRTHTRVSALHIAGIFAFSLVVICMLTVTGALDIYELRLGGLQVTPERINLQPFQRGYEELSYDNVMNFYLFIPFGFLLPALWKSYHNIIHVILTSFLFSLSIEISQLFNIRATDIDDLIMNTLGGVVGYMIHFIFSKIIMKKFWSECTLKTDKREQNFFLRNEGLCYILLAWIFNFLFKPFIKIYLYR